MIFAIIDVIFVFLKKDVKWLIMSVFIKFLAFQIDIT